MSHLFGRAEGSSDVPVKNTTLAAVVEELKKTGLQDLAGRWHAGSEDVACDVCTGRNMKAVKTYLDCLVSFCEKHLQPHHQMAPLTEHKLVEPCQNLQENLCASHNEVKTMFCRTHQQCVCFLCRGLDDLQRCYEVTYWCSPGGAVLLLNVNRWCFQAPTPYFAMCYVQEHIEGV